MNLRNALLGIGAVIIGLGFNSCDVSNNDDDFVCAEEYTGALEENEKVMLGKWKLVAIVAAKEVDITNDSESNPKKDIFAQYSECDQDADFTFEADRGYTNTQGQNIVSCTNKLKFTGSWKLTGNNLSFVGSCVAQNLELEFNGDKSTYTYTSSYNIKDVQGVTITTDVAFTYAKVVPDTELEPAE